MISEVVQLRAVMCEQSPAKIKLSPICVGTNPDRTKPSH